MTITNDDRANLASAERLGNIRTLSKASAALDALIKVLGDESLSHSTRTGLHVALSMVSERLTERADFLIENQETYGFGGGGDNEQ